MTKFRNKYRIESARLQNWDYGSNALYFITICTKNRKCFFGKIIEMQNVETQNVETQNFASLHFASPHSAPRHKYAMQLSEIGKMAEKCWYEIPEHFPFVKLDAFVVMPNHIHGIIEIAKPMDTNVDTNVETQNFASLHWYQQNPPSPQNKFGPQSKNLASIVRGYKIGVTKFAKKITQNWAWQPRYYDHIIRNHTSYQNIRNYIVNNPDNWGKDNFYKDNNR